MHGVSGHGRPRPVHIVVRFTTSQADLLVPVTDANHLSILGLKRQIRKGLSQEANGCRLRLIWSGKVLTDRDALSRAITIPPPPPPSTPGGPTSGKGKEPVGTPARGAGQPRVYIHCSIGDSLAPTELEAEFKASLEADSALTVPEDDSTYPAGRAVKASARHESAPRGFDRLLDAGFTREEVATLRTQFLAIQAHTHTPDTMPVGDELRMLEETWLENGAGGSGGATDAITGGSTEGRDIEDLLWGIVMGFFWPVAAVCWLMKEEGVWSPRRQTSVWIGALINVVFGAMRYAG